MPAANVLVDKCIILIDGTAITLAEMNNLSFLEVDLTAEMPSMCVMEFHDDQATMIDGTKFDIGKAVQVKFQLRSSQSATVVFSGEVVAIEPVFMGNSISLKIIAFDKLHRLNRSVKAKSFVQVSDADVMTTIFGDAGVSASIASLTAISPQIVQDNVTDLEMVRFLARRNGLSLSIDPVSGQAKVAIITTADSGVILKRGDTLLDFRPRISNARQTSEVTVKGWNFKTKQAAVGVANAPTGNPQIGYGKNGKTSVTAAFSAQPIQEYHPQAVEQSVAENIAKARLNEINGQFLVAEGNCFGDPRILPNTRLEIQNVGTKFSGKYIVTRVIHRFDLEQGYLCDFTVEGRAASTTADLMNAAPLEAPKLWPGVYPAIVSNVNDPDGMGRVKVKFPWLSDTIETFWARSAYPGAGNQHGLINLPEVNDEVLVAFEGGSFNTPFVVGGLYNGTDKPPINPIVNNVVMHRVWKTRTGHELHFYESSSDSKIELKEKNGYKVTLDGQNKKIEIIDPDSNSIVIDGTAKKITVTSQGDIELSGKNINMTASAGVKITASSAVEVKGATIKLN